MKKVEQHLIDLVDIVPDENQPRKLFEPSKLASLKDSVKRLGVMTPITVERVGNKFLIVDGERRYRVSKDLGLKSISAVIIESQTLADRLIQQFHIQEQKEEWTSTEKASTIYNLSQELGVSLQKVCDLLSLDVRTARNYVAFAEILDKKTYIRNEIGLRWAEPIKSLKELAKRIYKTKLDKVFDKDEERKLERAVLERIATGDLAKPVETTKIKDSFNKDPETIKKFLETNTSVYTLFKNSKAQGAYQIRNVTNHSGYVASLGNRFLENPDVKVTANQLSVLKSAHKTLTEIIKLAE